MRTGYFLAVLSLPAAMLFGCASNDLAKTDATETKVLRFPYETNGTRAYAANLKLEVKDVPAALENAKVLAVGSGGYVQKSSERCCLLRIPISQAEGIFAKVEKLGHVKSFRIERKDLNAQARKLSEQLAGLEPYYKVLQTAVSETTLTDSIRGPALKEFAKVRSEIAALKSKQEMMERNFKFVSLHVSAKKCEK